MSLTDAWWVLPFELNHGWTFAIYYTSAALLGEQYTAEGLQATVLGLSNSASQLGSLVATLCWSVLISEAGMRTAFTAAAALFACAALPLALELGRCARWLRAAVPRWRRRTGARAGGGSSLLDAKAERSSSSTSCTSSTGGGADASGAAAAAGDGVVLEAV